MRQGKPPFEKPDENRDAPDTFGSGPDEADFAVRPKGARRTLTPRDKERNRRVGELFRHVIPGLPIDADPPETRMEPEPLASLIEQTLKRLKINESPWLNDLNRAWPTLVPPEVARVTRPGKWEDGILFVYVTSSVTLFELRRTHLRRIEEAVKGFAGAGRVRQVRLMVNTVTLPFT
ncbi:MAG: DUF721 domain-containing protein [Kiritimatiellae bacterium]|jgi:hypothetical protein|nr:DUF721 domain-containing protein [Kiritimatiellia bacterium]NLF99179.1 DUF721 domain-containing protein [Lentisphaerota bacterium]